MNKKEVKETANDLLAAWDNGAERALDNAARAWDGTARVEELVEQELNNVAGMHIESGLCGGIWGLSGTGKCTCNC